MADGPLPQQQASTDQQQIASASILLQIVMLGLSFVLGHVLRRHKIYYINEASASLLLGLFVGAIANISNTETHFRLWFNFHEEFFFLFLLPPIILYPHKLKKDFLLLFKPFFSNFGAICIFAILGTFIASIITGILVYLGGLFFLMYRLPFQESVMFGALISATDPVSVLAIFQELGTDVNLYALVFGESVLNDAVAISLYRTLMSVRQHPLADHSLTTAVWSFLELFIGSLSTGSFCSTLLLFLHNLECCLIVLFPYFSYMLAEGLGLSGIVAILFCGILMKHYTFPNLSDSAQAFTAGFFQLISSLAETFVFIYMGMDIAIKQHSWSHVGFIFFSIVFIIMARAANVFPCAYIVNMLRPASRQIPINHQKALCFSGLRGAMAFALALQSVHDLPEGHGETIVTATTAIVVLTVIVLGGSTSTMLGKLGVAEAAHSNNLDTDGDEEEIEGLTNSFDDEEAAPMTSLDNLTVKLQEIRRSTATFTAIDKNFLRPFFTKDDKRRNSTEGHGKEVGDSQRGLSQALDERQTKSTGALNGMLAEDAAAMLDESRLRRHHSSTHVVQNRTNIVAGQSGESEQPIRPDSAVSTLQQPKETRLQQSSTLPKSEKKLRRPSA
ncbi:unnamed protein product [Sphagnum jensenii]|uniref:Sodium/hydrogen exchanger n=1 Tax=Sphagnum jensenii TaxID=128206 RepID=A0ABP1B2R2_9BRYO